MCPPKPYEKSVWNEALSLEVRIQACTDWISDIDQQMDACRDFGRLLSLEDLKKVLEELRESLFRELKAKGEGGPEGPLH